MFSQGRIDICLLNAMAFSCRIYNKFPIHDISFVVMLTTRPRTLHLHRHHRHHLVLSDYHLLDHLAQDSALNPE